MTVPAPPSAQLLISGVPAAGAVAGHQPWPRLRVKEIDWMVLVDRLRHCDWSVLSLWAAPAMLLVEPPVPAGTAAPAARQDPDKTAGGAAPRQPGREVCVALRDNQTGDVAVISLAVPAHGFPSMARIRPVLALLEQAAESRAGAPVADRPPGPVGVRLHGDADVAPAMGRASMVVGPAAIGIGEPVRFLVDVGNERIAALGVDLGYTRRGVEALLPGRMPAEAIRLVCRISAQAPVGLSWAFAAAVEAALAVRVPDRALWLRALMAELERVGRHFRYCAGINADAGETALADGWLILRERLLRVCDAAFGHRLLMDVLVPGGVADDLAADGRSFLHNWLKDTTAGLAELVRAGGAGRAAKARLGGLARLGSEPRDRIDLVGPTARASGRLVDARLLYGYAPYDRLKFTIPDRRGGDALARLELRVEEVRQSLSLIRQLVDGLPEGPLAVQLPRPALPAATGDAAEPAAAANSPAKTAAGHPARHPAGGLAGVRAVVGTPPADPAPEAAVAAGALPEGLAMVEGPDGEILASVRLDAQGRIAHCHLRDPAWLVWPLLPAVAVGAPIEDLALLRRSLAADVAAVDL